MKWNGCTVSPYDVMQTCWRQHVLIKNTIKHQRFCIAFALWGELCSECSYFCLDWLVFGANLSWLLEELFFVFVLPTGEPPGLEENSCQWEGEKADNLAEESVHEWDRDTEKRLYYGGKWLIVMARDLGWWNTRLTFTCNTKESRGGKKHWLW